MNARQIREQIATLLSTNAAAAARIQSGEASAEDQSAIEAAGQQLRDLQGQLQSAESRESQAADLIAENQRYNQPLPTAARSVAAQQGGRLGEPTERQPIDLRTIGEQFVDSESWQRATRSGVDLPVTRNDPFRTRSLRHPTLTHREGETLDRRAIIGSGTLPASFLFPDVVPGFFRPGEAPRNLRSVLINGQTGADAITIMQETAFTSAAAFVAEATADNGTDAAGGLKPESDLTFTEATFPVRTIAHWMRLTRQMMEDSPAMVTYINERLLTGLARKEDDAILNGSGTAPQVRGLLQTSGRQVADATYFTANPVKDAGTANENLNRLRRGKRMVRTGAHAMPSFIVLSPARLEELDTITDADRQYLIGGPLAPEQRTIWGLPVIESENIADTKAIVGDGSMAAVMDRQQSAIYTTDSHADYFIRNLFVILAEERFALPVFRPAAFVEVTLV